MVTAGCYLLIRISPILEYSSTSLMIIIWLGSLGALFGAACGKVDNDLKRVIAMSTNSQQGYKIVAIGISQYNLGLFHLLTHAFFKSLLFLSSGAILHAVKDNQDIRKKGSLNLFLPLTYLVFFFGSLSLMAFPFTSGWYSKDLLIELLITPNNFTHTIAYIFTLLAAFLTSSYSIRLKKIVMLSRPAFPKSIISYVTDSTKIMTIPLLIISIGAVTIGYLTHELFLSYGSTFYYNSIFIHPNSTSSLLDGPFSGSKLALIPLLFLLLMSILLFITPFNHNNSVSQTFINLDKFNITLQNNIPEAHKFTNTLTTMNHFNIFNHWIMHRTLILSNYLYRYLDKGILELFGPLGCQRFLHYLGFTIELLSTGFIPHYALIMVTSAILGLIFFHNFIILFIFISLIILF